MEHILNQFDPLAHPPMVLHAAKKEQSEGKAFIEANTLEVPFYEVRNNHIIPVFVKDNEPLISHAEFVDATSEIVSDVFHGEHILKPSVRLSHPIKGRIPEAKDKPAQMLLEREKTIYYERMMFVIEIPSIKEDVDGNHLSLTIGGVKSYNLDNLYSRSKSDQHFKVFIGFKNRVCTNLCVWTDGFLGELRVKSLDQLKASIQMLIAGYNQEQHLTHMKQFADNYITEQQFAHLIGRCRMFHHMPAEYKKDIPSLLFGDQQINTVVRDFYKDSSFSRDAFGNINLWRLYNLLTGA
ncbi:MAG: DUF3871 family protein, partial [Sediminibacterium sp.]